MILKIVEGISSKDTFHVAKTAVDNYHFLIIIF